jgi:hypothetical protein
MKHVLTVVTFIMGALCFAMYLITVKPNQLSAVPPPVKPAHCKMAISREPVCLSKPE